MLSQQGVGSLSSWLDGQRSMSGGWVADWWEHCGRGELELVVMRQVLVVMLVLLLVSLVLVRGRRLEEGMLGSTVDGQLVRWL